MRWLVRPALAPYIGKSTRLRTRVLSHFSGDHGNDREFSLSQQVRRIDHATRRFCRHSVACTKCTLVYVFIDLYQGDS